MSEIAITVAEESAVVNNNQENSKASNVLNLDLQDDFKTESVVEGSEGGGGPLIVRHYES